MSYTKTHLRGYLVQSWYLSPKDSDITIVIDGQRLPAHRFVLSAKSVVFRHMFFGSFKESSEKELSLDSDLNAFKVVLKYCYYERLTPQDWDCNHFQMAIDVFQVSHMYRIRGLCGLCVKKLTELLVVDNLIQVLEFAVFYRVKALIVFVKLFAKKFAKEIIVSKEFLSCDTKEVVRYLMKSMAIENQLEVIMTLKTIVDNNGWDFEIFLDLIRYECLTADDLKQWSGNDLIDSTVLAKIMVNKCKQLEERVIQLSSVGSNTEEWVKQSEKRVSQRYGSLRSRR